MNVQNKTITCYKENTKMNSNGNLIVMSQWPFYYFLVSAIKAMGTALAQIKYTQFRGQGMRRVLCGGGRWALVNRAKSFSSQKDVNGNA